MKVRKEGTEGWREGGRKEEANPSEKGENKSKAKKGEYLKKLLTCQWLMKEIFMGKVS